MTLSLKSKYLPKFSYSNAIGPFELRVYVEVDGTRHVIGEIVNFVAPLGAGCGNCDDHREAGHTLVSSTYITPELKVLVDQGYIPSVETEVLEPYLAENLKWGLYTLGVSAARYPCPEFHQPVLMDSL